MTGFDDVRDVVHKMDDAQAAQVVAGLALAAETARLLGPAAAARVDKGRLADLFRLAMTGETARAESLALDLRAEALLAEALGPDCE